MVSPGRLFSLATVISLLATLNVDDGAAQTNDPTASQDAGSSARDVRLFQSFFSDAVISTPSYLGGAASAQSFPGGNALELDAVAGYAFTPQIELQGRLGFVQVSPDDGDGSSGLTDLLVNGQYLFDDLAVNESGDVIDIGVGGYADLPIGEEDVGGGSMDFGVYGALRHDLNDGVALTGELGLDFVETAGSVMVGFCIPAIYFPVCHPGSVSEGGRETSLNLGGGAIFRTSDELHVVSELRIETEFDYAALSGGVDYAAPFGHIRGALLLGLDDGAPDVSLVAQLLRGF